MPTQRAQREWGRRVVAEYGSAGIAAQATHWMIQAGFPEDVIRVAMRVIGDELDHARLSHDTLCAIGGDNKAIEFDASRAAYPIDPQGVFISLIDTMIRNFCFGETLAVPLFRKMRENTTHPQARKALDRILKDEAVHKSLGWQSLDVLLQIEENVVKTRILQRFQQWSDDFFQGYGQTDERIRLTDAEKSVGMIDGIDYVNIFHNTLHNVIIPQMHKRNIPVEWQHEP